ncbi:MAG: peptide chain release factor N(5)-glutamine methyltransferase [Pseudomonadales bacterium]|nr:peptide chain release factor N(5)-glutamine methyltransferase [Pseudomonadales bacterium]
MSSSSGSLRPAQMPNQREMTLSVRQALALASSLASVSESPDLDVQLLLAQVLGKGRSYLFAHPDRILPALQQSEFQRLMDRRQKGEPMAYIRGRKEFWSIELGVSPDVLIPRPESEVLVESALSLFSHRPIEVAELGTGSGAIAIALASERPNWSILASDTSKAALLVAQANIARIFNGKSNIHLVLADWCQPMRQRCFDLIVSNPPYIRPSDPLLQGPPLVFEPTGALIAESDGLEDIGKIIKAARICLKPGGWLILEHGSDQSQMVYDNLTVAGYRRIESKEDLGDHNRAIAAQIPNL